MPSVSDNFNVSDGSQSRDPIRVISQDAPSVAISVWSQQGRGGNADLFEADVIVHGSTAEYVLDNFAPGHPIFVSGELVSEIDDNGYLSNEILADEISMLPTDRSGGANQSGGGASQQGRDNYQGQQGNAQGGQGGNRGGPSPQPGPRRQGGGGQNGAPQSGNNRQGGNRGGNRQGGGQGTAPAPRSR